MVELVQTRGVDFEFHVEDGEIVIDRCEGISPEQGLALFDPWVYEMMGVR